MALTYTYEVFSLLAAAAMIYASVILHRRFRTGATLALFLSVLLLGLYRAAYPVALSHFVRAQLGQRDLLAWFGHAIVPASMELLVAVSFLCVVRSALRPNNSFKPSPLRGLGQNPPFSGGPA